MYLRRPGADIRMAVYRLWFRPYAAWTHFRLPWAVVVVGPVSAPATLWVRWLVAWSTVIAGMSKPTSVAVSNARHRLSRTTCCCRDCSSCPSLQRVVVWLYGSVVIEQGTTKRSSLVLCAQQVTPKLGSSSMWKQTTK